LYATFIAQPHVPGPSDARASDGRSAFGAFIDRFSAVSAPPDATMYRHVDSSGGGQAAAAAGPKRGGGAAGQGGSSGAEEPLAPATQDL
jgi:hypothetical protein